MKTNKILFAFLITIFFLSEVTAQNEWYWLNPLPNGYTINDGMFLNINTGFAVGNNTFYKTTDGGINWNTDDLKNGYYFKSLDITNAGIIFIVGTKGKILKSTDLGDSWIDRSVDTLINLNDVFFITESTGYVVGNRILKTTNSGNNWVEQAALGSQSTLKAVDFINVNTGMAVGVNLGFDLLYRTSNGGINWITSSNVGGTFTCEDIIMLDESTSFVASQHDIFKTTDGGNNWYSSYHFQGGYKSIYFTSMLKGYAVGWDGLLLRTFDGGDQWYRSYIAPESPSVSSPTNSSNSISFTDSLNGFITGSYGLMYFTNDGGNSWNHQRESVNHLNNTFFTDEFTGYVCGQKGTIMKTTNTGSEWKQLQTNFNRSFNDLYFYDANTGVVVGDTGMILRTTNGGNNWTQSLSPTFNSITAVSFANQNYGLASCKSGVIIRTTNGGVSWISNPTGIINSFSDISYPSEDTAYAITLSQLYKSTNKGLNWNLISTAGGTSSYIRLQFFNSGEGIISRRTPFTFNPNKLCKTTNGGASFDTSTIGNNIFNFFDMNTGFATGSDNAKIVMTTNGGASWMTVLYDSEGVRNDFKSVLMINSTTAYIVGTYGSIIKARNTITGIDPGGLNYEKDFHLSQNYPNPFNPSTKINYALPTDGQVSIKIFDMAGKEVMSLVNEVKTAGYYSVSFNASNLSSGIYFYRLSAADFTATKKMMLVK